MVSASVVVVFEHGIVLETRVRRSDAKSTSARK